MTSPPGVVASGATTGAGARETAPALRDAGTSRRWTLLAALVITAGIVIRVGWYVSRKSLWQDELLISLNLLTRDLGTLLTRPLGLDQTAPPAFLFIEWVCVRLGGATEHALRFPSIVAGVALLPAAWWAFRPLLSRFASTLLVVLLAVSPALVRYSAEVKPYGVGALMACLVAGITLRLLDAPGSRRLWAALFGVGLFSAAGTVTAPFVLAPAWLLLLSTKAVRDTPGTRWWLAGSAAVWGAVFLVIELNIYMPVASDPLMQRFWKNAFLGRNGFDVWPITRRWLVGGLIGSAESLLPRGAGTLVILVLLGGLALVRNRGWRAGWLVGGPVLLAYAASAAGRYPLEVRLMLFAAPLVAAALAGGADYLAGRAAAGAPRQVAMGAAFLLAGPGLASLIEGGESVGWEEETRPLVRDSVLQAHPGEPVYLFVRAVPAWLFYRNDWRAPDLATTRRLMAIVEELGLASGSRPSRGRVGYHEGWDQVARGKSRRWLVGVPSGYEAVFRTDAGPDSVDAGWAESEAERLLREPGRCFWTFFSHFKPVEARTLERAITALGARVVYEHEESRARLRRYCERW